MIRVTLEFATEDALIQYFMRARVQLRIDPSTPALTIIDVQGEEVKPETPQAPAVEPPKKRTRRTKAPATSTPVVPETVSVMPDAQPAAEKKPNAPVAAMAVKPEDVAAKARALLMPVFNSKGGAAATEILKQFGVTRIVEFKAEQLSELAKVCAL